MIRLVWKTDAHVVGQNKFESLAVWSLESSHEPRRFQALDTWNHGVFVV